MKTNHILAIILVVSAGQAVASSALIKVGPQLSRAALMTTASAGHKKTYPIYLQKRHLMSEEAAAVCLGTQIGLTPIVSGSMIYAQTGNIGFSLCGALVLGAASYKVNMGVAELFAAKIQKIEDLNQQLLEKNKIIESQNKN